MALYSFVGDRADGDHVGCEEGDCADGKNDVEREHGADVDAVEDACPDAADDDSDNRDVVAWGDAGDVAMERNAFVAGEGEHLPRGTSHCGEVCADIQYDKDDGETGGSAVGAGGDAEDLNDGVACCCAEDFIEVTEGIEEGDEDDETKGAVDNDGPDHSSRKHL
jgi:hypothetical protein